jgi:hypothetical protein
MSTSGVLVEFLVAGLLTTTGGILSNKAGKLVKKKDWELKGWVNKTNARMTLQHLRR